MVQPHFLMNDMIEPMEIGNTNNRYISVNISEFDMVIPQQRNGA